VTIRAILFDLDGVLVDAREWHYEALNRALNLFGYQISRDDHLESFDGLPTRKKLEMLSKDHKLPVGLHEFINRMKQNYTAQIINSHCRPTFIQRYALSRLHADGYRLAVCSNSVRATLTSMLSNAALIEWLEFYLSNEDVAKPKPDPEIYQTAIERMQLRPTECLIVEDNPNGIKAAIASGGHVMQVSDVSQVSYQRIRGAIRDAEQGKTR
jgi:beta-phosphoglucomutase